MNGLAKFFHWSIAALIVLEVPAGFIMSRTYISKDAYDRMWQLWTSNYHHTAGLIILILAICRLIWRMRGRSAPRVDWKHRIAAMSHWILYALILVIPLSGWAALSALADSAEFGVTQFSLLGTNGFDHFIPRIVTPRDFDDTVHMFTYSFFAKAHRWLLFVGALFLFLHVAAALHHHFIVGDNTLRNMLPKIRKS